MQMKMLLTRLGEESRMVITGDPSQIDLPRGTKSGLVDSLDVLRHLPEIKQIRFTEGDVIRHPLVGKIVTAYNHQDRTRDKARNKPQEKAKNPAEGAASE